jgi:hypothetical protein
VSVFTFKGQAQGLVCKNILVAITGCAVKEFLFKGQTKDIVCENILIAIFRM